VSPARWRTREKGKKNTLFIETKDLLKGLKVLIVFLEMCGKMCYGNCARGALRPPAAMTGKTR